MRAIPCTLMRGGTSKGIYFHAGDLPSDVQTRDRVLLAALGSPDPRQIDGIGGAHPLTSKVAVISRSSRPDADVDYLFLQVFVDQAIVSDGQNCGNILAGVGPFAIENGLVLISGQETKVRIHMVNTGGIAIAHVPTPGGAVSYEGDAEIDGVPGTAAPIFIEFLDVAGSTCGALFPTGSERDVVEGVNVTCIDNGMPVVIMKAQDFGKTGAESPEQLETDVALKHRVEAIRLAVGEKMKLGDVSKKTTPKMCLISPSLDGGAVSTRTFIPHRVHESIGVFAALSVATACMARDSVAAEIAQVQSDHGKAQLKIEHPTGFFTVDMEVNQQAGLIQVSRSALLRTARKIMKGEIYVRSAAWGEAS